MKISELVFWAQSTTRDYIRAEGEFKELNTVETKRALKPRAE